MIKKNLYYAHYLAKEEFDRVRISGKQADMSFRFTLMVEPIQYFDRISFSANILEIAEAQADYLAFDTKDNWQYVKFSSLRSRTYSQEYWNKQPGAFTFDGITFYKLVDIRPMPGNEVQFFFRQIERPHSFEANRAFMVMPFHSEQINEFFSIHIRKFLKEKASIDVIRADDFADNDVIIETIFQEISKAEFVLCEISECNKNVFFEIGYAKGINKEMIFLARKDCELKFFDVNHIRRIEYEINRPLELEERLIDTIHNIRKRIQ